MGGEPGGPGGWPRRTRGSGGRSPPVYKCTVYKGGPGARV